METNLEDLRRKHAALSRFVVYLLVILALYDLSLEVLIRARHLHGVPPSATTAAVVLIISLVLFRMIRKMGYPLRDFGFNLDNLRRNVAESLVWTAGFCLLLLVVKWLLITRTETYSSWPLFYHPSARTLHLQLAGAAIYTGFAFFQCLIVHGALQSCLLKFLATPRAGAASVAVTTLTFAALHVDMHFTFALITLAPGFMWAAMYAKQRSLVGVTLSHALVGVWALWGLDFYQMMNLVLTKLGGSPQGL
jgi:membrane protease YdiL (CAAX protease family)